MRDTRRFVEASLEDLSALWNGEARIAREEIAKQSAKNHAKACVSNVWGVRNLARPARRVYTALACPWRSEKCPESQSRSHPKGGRRWQRRMAFSGFPDSLVRIAFGF